MIIFVSEKIWYLFWTFVWVEEVSGWAGWQVGGKITSRDLLLRKQWSLWSAAGTRGEGGSLVLLGVLGTLVRGTWSLVTSPRIPRPLSSSPLLPFSETPSLSQSYSPNHPVPCFWWLFSRMTRMMRQVWSNIRPWHIYITLSLKFGLRWWGCIVAKKRDPGILDPELGYSLLYFLIT